MKNYTHILNEGFNSYFKKLNESAEKWVVVTRDRDDDSLLDGTVFLSLSNAKKYLKQLKSEEADYENSYYDIEEVDPRGSFADEEPEDADFDESLKLDEAIPRDLMDRIKYTRNYRFGNNGEDPNDYQSANMEEITATDVMRMKKSGEDLSDIYVLSDDGHLISLDREGHPWDYKSTGNPRANQSLKKTLDNAAKIYKGKIERFSQAQPDKYAERNSDPDRRSANRNLGKNRLTYGQGDIAKDFRRGLEEPGKEINRIKKAYEEGDISRKEMEAKIAKEKERRERDSWDARGYNKIKNARAEARYYDSNQEARKNIDAYEEAKDSLDWAKYKLKDNEEKLAKAQAGSGYGNQRVAELKRKIASLKADLAYYEKELAEDPVQKDLDDLQRYINSATQEIKDNQEIIDKLLHRK